MNQNKAYPTTVLIVDDSPANIVSMQAILSPLGCGLIAASDGEEALNLLLEADVSLLLLDVNMPGMDGYEVAELVLSNSRTRHIPIIFVTATDPHDVDILKGYDIGCVDFISKPVNPLLLQSKVRVLLEIVSSRERLRQVNTELSNAKNYYSSILSSAAEGILVVGLDGYVSFANHAAGKILRCRESELLGLSFVSMITPVGNPPPTWDQSIFSRKPHNNVSFRLYDALISVPNGTPIPVSLSCARLPGPTAGMVAVFQDISVTKTLQQQLQQQAISDPLTGLLNRSGFQKQLYDALERAKRLNTKLAVIYMDLDGFKRINDTFGHDKGDQLLREVARRLSEVKRSYDALARLGGDEFTMVLDNLKHSEDAARIAQKLLEALKPPYLIDDIKLTVPASLGLANFPNAGETADELMQAADMAMYEAKSQGHNLYRFYDENMEGKARTRLLLEQSLREGIELEEFYLTYQPQICLKTFKLRGVEALLRWNHTNAGEMLPGEFIPLLEETGLIVPLGRWIIEQACGEFSQLLPELRQYSGSEEPILAINISTRQFNERLLIDDLNKSLERHNLMSSQLELEITETSLMQDEDYAATQLHKARALGIKIAIDDFGTGYSSLAYLKLFPIDVLKIDRLFISNIHESQKDEAIARSIVQLGHNLQLDIIAEGIEDLHQHHWAVDTRVDIGQGFLFAKPAPHHLLADVIKKLDHNLPKTTDGNKPPTAPTTIVEKTSSE
ncbi:MAG: EAL domain-containing protein [Hahellaceae bacterium]|nr:EAL domain-containing protein [Hahellaceae bacterium]